MERGLLDLAIARTPGIGQAGRVYLCLKFNRESDFTGLKARDIERICAERRGKTGEKRLFDDETENWSVEDVISQAEKDAEFMRRRGIRWLSIAEDAYPPLLREIYDPPAVLFYRGTLPPPEKPFIAMVGTRKAGAVAVRWAYDTARDLSLAGLVVVSGLAIGIDAMTHRGSVDAASGGTEAAPTLAVLGSSVDEVYPASNRALARRIIAGGGALLSEYPPGTRPAKWTFPARNRIISGLCRCVIVVEAGEKSGALITADFALEHNRSLCVAGGGESKPLGAGCGRLAEDGAKVVNNFVDIMAELGLEM
ncbi:MAG: DNA-processing protein DprA [Spirochaetaceae bacterium]|jgi:DNA processing protein|nr:DNA-processing protein DprA [Spirochaetaceae bacterium]